MRDTSRPGRDQVTQQLKWEGRELTCASEATLARGYDKFGTRPTMLRRNFGSSVGHRVPPGRIRMRCMDLTLTPEQEMVRKTAREFADREIAPFARDWDRAEEMDRSIVGK